ncbi:unnamed protein product, partial [Aphanomyces euteiches]
MLVLTYHPTDMTPDGYFSMVTIDQKSTIDNGGIVLLEYFICEFSSMKLFGIVAFAVMVCAAMADESPSVVQDGSLRELTGRSRFRAAGRAVVAVNRLKQNTGNGGQGGPSQQTYVAPTPYETAVCFKHHGCGLEGKRGERDRAISPIIPGVTHNQCCNKKSGEGGDLRGELVHTIVPIVDNRLMYIISCVLKKDQVLGYNSFVEQ